MGKYSRLFLLLAAFLAPPVLAGAYDFGLILNQNAGYGNSDGGESKFDYQADILPHFSFLIGDNKELFVSAGMTFGYNEEFTYVPELLRTDFSMRFGNSGIRAGRMFYSDPLSFIANGLFDGVQFTYNGSMGSFNVGAWYTGLLYKKNANITMTEFDQAKFDSPIEYGDFIETYFAPQRLLFAAGWEHPSIAEMLRLRASVIGQFDFTKAEEKYHSQYLAVKAGMPFNSFLFELGGSLELSQNMLADESKIKLAFAGEAGVFWTLPSSFLSRLSFTGTFTGGNTDGTAGAFIPITTKYFGNIFEQKISGLSVLDLTYSARIMSELGASVSALYFIRSDKGTYYGYPVNGDQSEGYFLGAELFARLIWSPVSDLQLNLGGGMFLPALGNAAPDEKALWRIELTAILAVY